MRSSQAQTGRAQEWDGPYVHVVQAKLYFSFKLYVKTEHLNEFIV